MRYADIGIKRRRSDRSGDVDTVQQRRERGDLVGLPVTTHWPSTIPSPCSSAASRCTARSSAPPRAPRADLPSTAMGPSATRTRRRDPRRGSERDPHRTGPRALLRRAVAAAGRGRRADAGGAGDQPVRHHPVQRLRVDLLQDPADRRLARRRSSNREPEPDPGAQRQVMGPFGDRDVAAGPGQHRAHRQREHRHQPVPDPAAGTRIWHLRQRCHQIGRRIRLPRVSVSVTRSGVDPTRAASKSIGEDGQAGTTRSDGQSGVGTLMITSGSCPHPHLPHHRRVTTPTRRD